MSIWFLNELSGFFSFLYLFLSNFMLTNLLWKVCGCRDQLKPRNSNAPWVCIFSISLVCSFSISLYKLLKLSICYYCSIRYQLDLHHLSLSLQSEYLSHSFPFCNVVLKFYRYTILSIKWNLLLWPCSRLSVI